MRAGAYGAAVRGDKPPSQAWRAAALWGRIIVAVGGAALLSARPQPRSAAAAFYRRPLTADRHIVSQRPWTPASPEPEFGCGPEGKCEDEDSSHSECKCNGKRPSPFGLACDIGPALGFKVFEALPADIKPLTVLGAAASGVDRSLFVTTWCQGLRTD